MKVVIYGTSNIAELVYFWIKTEGNLDVVGFVAKSKYIDSSEFCELPLTPFESILDDFSTDEVQILSIGPYTNVLERQQMTEEALGKGFTCINYISSKATVAPDVVMGVNNIVLPGVFIDCKGVMGNGNLFRPNSYLGHEFKMGSYNYIAPNCSISGYSDIGDFCFLGIGSTVKDSVKISSRTTLGAHSLLLKDSDPDSVYMGVPAKKRG